MAYDVGVELHRRDECPHAEAAPVAGRTRGGAEHTVRRTRRPAADQLTRAAQERRRTTTTRILSASSTATTATTALAAAITADSRPGQRLITSLTGSAAPGIPIGVLNELPRTRQRAEIEASILIGQTSWRVVRIDEHVAHRVLHLEVRQTGVVFD